MKYVGQFNMNEQLLYGWVKNIVFNCIIESYYIISKVKFGFKVFCEYQ